MIVGGYASVVRQSHHPANQAEQKGHYPWVLLCLVVVDRSGISNIIKFITNVVLNMFSNSNSDDLNSPTSFPEKPKPRRSLLHDGIVIKGDWHSDGIVEFGGKITGDLSVDVLVVTGTGKVDGNVRARSVTVEGHLNGTIAAVDVILASTAVFTGEIVAERIQIDFGANVEGLLKATAKDTA